MRGHVTDLTGRKFGQLTVIRCSEPDVLRKSHWICRCTCGRHVRCRADNLKSGHSTRCSVCAGGTGHGSVFVEGVMEV